MPFFGAGNPELVLVTRWIAVIQPGPEYDPAKSYVDQALITEHLAYYHSMLEREEMLIGGPFTSLHSELIIFADRVSNYGEAKRIMDADPAIAAGVLSAHIEEWFSNAIGGGRAEFFSEDSVSVRRNGRLFVQTGYGVLAEEVGANVIGEVAEEIGRIVGPDDGTEAEKLGRGVGAEIGDEFGRAVANVVTGFQGGGDQPGLPEPEIAPTPEPASEEDYGAPLPFMTTRWVVFLAAGPNYDPMKLTPQQHHAPAHVSLMEKYVLEGKLLLAGPLTTFFTAWIIFSEEVTTFEETKKLIDVDAQVVYGELDRYIVQWFTNIRKGESSGYFSADTAQVRNAGERLIKAGFFPMRPEPESLG